MISTDLDTAKTFHLGTECRCGPGARTARVRGLKPPVLRRAATGPARAISKAQASGMMTEPGGQGRGDGRTHGVQK